MNNFLHNLTRAALAVAIFFGAIRCADTPEDEAPIVDPLLPTISSVAICGELTQSSASVKVEFLNCDNIYYAYEQGDAKSFDAAKVTFEKVVFEDDATSVEFDLDGLVALTDYVVGVYGVNVDGRGELSLFEFTTPDEPVEVPTLSVNVSEDLDYVSFTTSSGVSIFYAQYLTSEAPAEADLEWLECEVIDVATPSVIFIDDDLAAGNYTLKAYAVDAEGVKSEVVSITFDIPEKIQYFAVKDVRVTPLSISVDIDIFEEVCSMVAFGVGSSLYFNESAFVGGFATGYIENIITSDTTMVYRGTPNSPLLPNTAYAVGVSGLNYLGETVDAWEQVIHQYEAMGDVYMKSYTTAPFEVGASDAAVELVVDDSEVSVVGMNAIINRVGDCESYIFTYTKKANIANGVEAWIASSGWFADPYLGINSFYDTANGEYLESSSQDIRNLESGVEYTLIACGVDKDGYLGDVVSLDVKTRALDVSTEIEYSVVVDPDKTSAKFDVTFGSNCAKVYYFHMKQTEYAKDSDAEEMLMYYLGGTNNCLSVDDAVDGVVSVEIANLTMISDYNFYSIGVSADGGITDMNKLSYSTDALDFNSAASLELSVKEVTTNDYGNTVVVLNVAMNEHAVKYIYAVIDDYITDKSNIDAYGTAALNAWDKKTTASPVAELKLYDSTYLGVFIPVDKDGNYGTPVKYIYDGWE